MAIHERGSQVAEVLTLNFCPSCSCPQLSSVVLRGEAEAAGTQAELHLQPLNGI